MNIRGFQIIKFLPSCIKNSWIGKINGAPVV